MSCDHAPGYWGFGSCMLCQTEATKADAKFYRDSFRDMKKLFVAESERVTSAERALEISNENFARQVDEVARLREALEDIFRNSQDNWAAARAESGLGKGRVAVPSKSRQEIQESPELEPSGVGRVAQSQSPALEGDGQGYAGRRLGVDSPPSPNTLLSQTVFAAECKQCGAHFECQGCHCTLYESAEVPLLDPLPPDLVCITPHSYCGHQQEDCLFVREKYVERAMASSIREFLLPETSPKVTKDEK